jgi:hypothetical protein
LEPEQLEVEEEEEELSGKEGVCSTRKGTMVRGEDSGSTEAGWTLDTSMAGAGGQEERSEVSVNSC